MDFLVLNDRTPANIIEATAKKVDGLVSLERRYEDPVFWRRLDRRALIRCGPVNKCHSPIPPFSVVGSAFLRDTTLQPIAARCNHCNLKYPVTLQDQEL